MKFSHTLSLNANPDWAEHYIDYASLKKLIKESAAVATVDEEILVQESQTKFLQKLMEMVTTVREFYYKTLGELNQELARLKPILEKSASYLDLAEAATADATEDTSLLRSRKLKSLTTIKEKSGTDSNNDSNLEQIRRETIYKRMRNSIARRYGRFSKSMTSKLKYNNNNKMTTTTTILPLSRKQNSNLSGPCFPFGIMVHRKLITPWIFSNNILPTSFATMTQAKLCGN